LTREVDHRAKNVLAVVQAALRLTPKDDPEAYVPAVEGRIAALARAQALLAQEKWVAADLRAIVEGELQPFLAKSARPANVFAYRASPTLFSPWRWRSTNSPPTRPSMERCPGPTDIFPWHGGSTRSRGNLSSGGRSAAGHPWRGHQHERASDRDCWQLPSRSS
jgi:hypothetical protein